MVACVDGGEWCQISGAEVTGSCEPSPDPLEE